MDNEGTIYLVVAGREAFDYNGRTITEFRMEDGDECEGYFTSLVAAQAWIHEQQTEGNKEYQAALESFPKRLEAFRTRKAKFEANENDIAERAKSVGVPYQKKRLYESPPMQPQLSYYLKTEYEIWEVNPHV